MLPCFPSRHNVVSLGNLYDSTIIFTGRTAYSDNQTYECYKCDICSLHDSSEIKKLVVYNIKDRCPALRNSFISASRFKWDNIIVSVFEKSAKTLLVELIIHLHALWSIVFKEKQKLFCKFEHTGAIGGYYAAIRHCLLMYVVF